MRSPIYRASNYAWLGIWPVCTTASCPESRMKGGLVRTRVDQAGPAGPLLWEGTSPGCHPPGSPLSAALGPGELAAMLAPLQPPAFASIP